MKRKSWISLIGFCLMTTFGAALVFAAIMAGASVALADHQTAVAAEEQAGTGPSNDPDTKDAQPELTTLKGMITDSHCGARHMRRSNLSPSNCAAMCIRTGAHYLLVNGDHRYKLNGDANSLSKLLGTRASVTGTLQGDTIEVNSAAPISLD
ncbi:MAG TPA: hypothetical protein VJ731_05880 [Terriglobales bacterium]|nr:hypothetical protein [Terriglobales bacterium]